MKYNEKTIIDRQHIMLRKGSIITVGFANEEKGVVENYDLVIDKDICVCMEEEVPARILEKRSESRL